MSASAESQDWHVLDFFSDEHGSCALTALARGVRFHIIADADKIDPNSDAGIQYRNLLQDLTGDDTEQKHVPEPPDQCKDDTDTDSGIDVNDNTTAADKKSAEGNNDGQSMDAETLLQNWISSPLNDSLDSFAPPKKSSTQQTLQAWYQCPTLFYELAVSADGHEAEAIELESSPELEKRVQGLLPMATLPKYLANKIDVPIFQASDLYVLEASDQPIGTPYHPCRVRLHTGGETLFLKVIDNVQPDRTKRELDILSRIKKLCLHEQMNVPVLQGLVAFDDTEPTPAGKKRIMGFLQTDIPNPTSLHKMLDPNIPQKKRNHWAKEAERMKDILHENDIIWGDAKADNFMVDEDDSLWIIDFGGSYTEGWVDPELNETEAGDDMGTMKIVNALEDPVANTHNPEHDRGDDSGDGIGDDDEDGAEGDTKDDSEKYIANQDLAAERCETSARKRKMGNSGPGSVDDESPSVKRTRR